MDFERFYRYCVAIERFSPGSAGGDRALWKRGVLHGATHPRSVALVRPLRHRRPRLWPGRITIATSRHAF